MMGSGGPFLPGRGSAARRGWLKGSTSGGHDRGRCSGVRESRAVNRSDLAGPGTGGDVGPAVSAHLADEPRPDLTQDGSPVEGIIPEFAQARPPVVVAAADSLDAGGRASASRHQCGPWRRLERLDQHRSSRIVAAQVAGRCERARRRRRGSRPPATATPVRWPTMPRVVGALRAPRRRPRRGAARSVSSRLRAPQMRQQRARRPRSRRRPRPAVGVDARARRPATPAIADQRGVRARRRRPSRSAASAVVAAQAAASAARQPSTSAVAAIDVAAAPPRARAATSRIAEPAATMRRRARRATGRPRMASPCSIPISAR